jgi:hypothetical protein
VAEERSQRYRQARERAQKLEKEKSPMDARMPAKDTGAENIQAP